MAEGYIKIENAGAIPNDAFTLIGATSKRENEGKIGFFGSGLKYSIAVLLKHNIDFFVYSGNREVKISKKKKNFRGSKVEVITVNGKETSLTTDMGPDWYPWFAVREIYCNAIDEGGQRMTVAGEPQGESGKTVFYIKNDDRLKELFENWDSYFSENRTDIVYQYGGTTFFTGSYNKSILYRRGVRCFERDEPSVFHYDADWFEINESRVLSSTLDVNVRLASFLALYATEDMARRIFEHINNDVFEYHLYWDSTSMFNENWLKALDGRKIIIDQFAGHFQSEREKYRTIILPSGLARGLQERFGDKVEILGFSSINSDGIEVEPTVEQANDLSFACKFLNDAGLQVKCPVKVFEFKHADKDGEARDGEILLSTKVFERGRREVVKTVLHEVVHVESGFSDKTREFEDYIFDVLLRSYEKNVGTRL